MAKTREVTIPIVVETDDVKRGRRETERQMTLMGRVINGIFERIGHRIVDSLIAIPRRAFQFIRNQFTSAVNEAIQFQTALAEVSTLGQFDMQRLRHEIENVAMALGSDLVNATKAVYQAISAGIPEENVIDFLRDASKAAVAGLTDVETSVNALTSVLNAYRLEADQAGKVSDLFFKTIQLGKTRYEELAGSIGRLVPIAAAANLSLEEMFAALAQLTQVGLKTEEAVVGLRSILSQLIQPSEEAMAGLTGIYGWGVDMLEVLGERGLAGVLKDILETEQRFPEYFRRFTLLREIIADVRGLNAALALDPDSLLNTIYEMDTATGTTEAAFLKMQDTIEGAWRRIKAVLGTIRTTILQPFIDVGPQILNAIADWFEPDPSRLTEQEIKLIRAMGIEPEGKLQPSIIDKLRRWAETTTQELKAAFDAYMSGDMSFADAFGKWIDAAKGAMGQIMDAAKEFINAFGREFAIGVISAIKREVEALMPDLPAWFHRLAVQLSGPMERQIPGVAPPLGPVITEPLPPGTPPAQTEPPPWRGEMAPITVNVYGAERTGPELAREIRTELERYRRADPAYAGVF